MAELLTLLAKALVRHPEAVRVEQREDERGIVLHLTVAESDMGQVIGREGRIAKALRTVMRAVAHHQNTRVMVEIG